MKARIGLLFIIAFLGASAAEVVQHPDLDSTPSQVQREEKPREPAAQPTPHATPDFTPFPHVLRK